MKKYFLSVAIWILVFTSFVLAGSIFNPGFELYDHGQDFDTPSGWTVENYATSVNGFIPNNYDGDHRNWQIDIYSNFPAYEGSRCLLLSTGDSLVDHGKVSQQITIEAGDKISGAYFFGSCDYKTWADYAEIKLTSQTSGLSDILLVNIGVEQVGDYGSTNGWITFESEEFTALNAGSYILDIGVYDKDDSQLASYFAVDGLHIPEPASVLLFLSGLCLFGKK